MASEDEITLKLIRGEIAGLPEDDQVKVRAAAANLRAVIEQAGDHGLLALALVGAELQVMQV
jgi:hypothetical protein